MVNFSLLSKLEATACEVAKKTIETHKLIIKDNTYNVLIILLTLALSLPLNSAISLVAASPIPNPDPVPNIPIVV
jgi:hypothetical protein